MTVEEVYVILEANQNDKGIAHWEKLKFNNWTSFGIGLTQLKKIAKQIGKNHELAQMLWQENNYEARNLGILLEEPKKVNKEQIEMMCKNVSMWMMSHTFVQNLFSKVAFAKTLAEAWRNEKDDVKRRIGYSFLYYYAKDKKVTDDYFLPIIKTIERNLQQEENFVKDAMNNALFAIGQRSKFLNKSILTIAKKIGKVEVYYGENSCEAVDVVKHLSSERVMKKFA